MRIPSHTRAQTTAARPYKHPPSPGRGGKRALAWPSGAEATWDETIGDLAADLDRIIARPISSGCAVPRSGPLVERTTRHTTLLHPPPMAGHREEKRIHNGPAPAVRECYRRVGCGPRRRSLQVPDSQTARRPYPSCTSPPRETRPNQPPTSHLTRASPLGPLHEEPTPTAPADTTKTLPYRTEASRHARAGRETPKGRRRTVNQRNP